MTGPKLYTSTGTLQDRTIFAHGGAGVVVVAIDTPNGRTRIALSKDDAVALAADLVTEAARV